MGDRRVQGSRDRDQWKLESGDTPYPYHEDIDFTFPTIFGGFRGPVSLAGLLLLKEVYSVAIGNARRAVTGVEMGSRGNPMNFNWTLVQYDMVPSFITTRRQLESLLGKLYSAEKEAWGLRVLAFKACQHQHGVKAFFTFLACQGKPALQSIITSH